MKKRKPLEIDGVLGSELRDTQGEMLSVEGADISELEAGRGRWNDNHGKGFFNSIGRITKAKKIFKKEDCEDDRQRYYWDKIKAPYIYGAGYLYDDDDHPNAKAAAAILRNIHKADTPLQLKASVEGGVVARGIKDPSLLARTKIHSCALTFTPANNATLIEPMSLKKSQYDEIADMLLIKSVMHLAQTNVPSFRHIARDASATKVQNNLAKLVDLMKELGIEGEITIPSKESILRKALEQKIQSNLEEIHAKMASLKKEELEKAKMKNAMTAAGIGAAMALAPSMVSSSEPKVQKQPVVQQQVNPKVELNDVLANTSKQYPLLGAIANVESSNGKNLQHKTMNEGIHKGMTAGGPYGMMPHSAAFILQKDPELAKKYPKLLASAKDVSKHHKDFTDAFNNDPQAAADFAVAFYKRNKGKTKSDQQLTYSWLNGLKGSWDKYKEGGEQALDEHPYVQNVMKEYSKLKPKKAEKPKQDKPLKKAMTAGYGGGGSPGALSGGGVLQSEALDEGRSKLKYISCDNCGKEQVYSKHQVKCRECGHGMSFEKLYGAMRGNKK
jgi:hypothetical protein